ncbi:MAG: hypothetical protein ACLQVI_26275 [Polyangiaceae bacterium]|jgi:hypothetical protein
MRLAAAILLPASLVLATGGCAVERVSLSGGPREYVASDYPEILKRWTRDESLINVTELETPLVVTATFETWDFRWAYVVRYAQDYRLTVEQRRALLEQTLKESTESHQFYVALYGSSWRWSDLTRPNSAWIVRLIDDLGDETAPTAIEHIVKPGALERTYFPYTSTWRQAFRIRFPRVAPDRRPTIAPNAHWVGLRFAGAEGNEELRWDLDTGTAQRLASASQ